MALLQLLNRFNRNKIFWSILLLLLVAIVTTLTWSTELEALYGQRCSVRREVACTFNESLRVTQPPVVCPENDIPGSDRNVTIVLNVTNWEEVEEEIFQPEGLVDARRFTQDANESISGLYRDNQQEAYMLNGSSSKWVRVGNYWYLPGGHWIPADCVPRWKVAFIIPFRNRSVHLPIFLRHIIPFMKAQFLEFGIFVVEQANSLKFNKATLMNIGYLEARNFTQWDCFIFHDVDHIPLNYGNYYGCGGLPRHFMSGVDRWGYKLEYNNLFGGATGFTQKQFLSFNGFPNVYWGWGGEDDDIFERTRSVGLFRTRPRGQAGFYNVIPHHHKSASKNNNRICLLRHFRERLFTDGLNNLKYEILSVTLLPLYVNISADIRHLPWNDKWRYCGKAWKGT